MGRGFENRNLLWSHAYARALTVLVHTVLCAHGSMAEDRTARMGMMLMSRARTEHMALWRRTVHVLYVLSVWV